MTSTLLKQVERLRYLAILLLAVCGFANANAQDAATSDEINEAIASGSAILPTWTNDAEHPWYLAEDSSSENGSYKVRSTDLGTKGVSSTLTMNYTSEYETALYLSAYVYEYNDVDGLKVLVNGEEMLNMTGSQSYKELIRIPAGSNKVEFVLTNRYADIYGFWVGEAGNLASSCVKEGSLPLTFTNDSAFPWVMRSGFIQSTNFTEPGTKSKISTTFTVDKISWFSFECKNVSYYCTTNVYVDGKLKTNFNKDSSGDNAYKSFVAVLDPGKHTVEIETVVLDENEMADKGLEVLAPSVVTNIRNVCLDNAWDEVAVTAPGQFVANLVDVIGDRSVLDVEFLKITGSLNSKDWEGIKQLKGIVAIDMTGTDVEEIPSQAFYSLSELVTVLFPETLKRIKNEAFVYTNCSEIVIPASVEYIDKMVWSGTPLSKISFAENSKLTTINKGAFQGTKIEEFNMPNSVVQIEGSYWDGIFYGCRNLKDVHLSESLKSLPDGTFRSSGLEYIELPESLESIGTVVFTSSKLKSIKIPTNVVTIGESAFSDCEHLKEVTLNSYTNALYTTFAGCDSIQTINLPSVTPPSVRYNGSVDPFSGVDKETVTVLVPEFALGAYKADSYWFQFRNLKSSAEISTADFWAIHGHLKLNPSSTLSGTPSIEIEAGGILDVAEATPLTLNEVTYSNQEAVPAVFLNESDKVTATKLTTKFSVPQSGKWYFFSPVTDVNMADVTYPATDSWVIRYYDGARRADQSTSTGNWITMPADGVLKRGQGYIIQAAMPGTLIMPAATTQHSAFFGTEEAVMTLADNESSIAEHAGWNLVGNPYPTFYDIYSMDLEAPITVWDGSTYRAYSLADDDFVIRPMQPFFVQKSDADLTLGMPRGGRLGTSTITRASAPRANVVDPLRNKLNIEIVSGDRDEADDYTRIVINEAASMAYDGKCDASKFMSLDSEVAQIYSLGDNHHPLAINERPYADGNAQLGIYIPQAGTEYRIAASRADRKAWLYDSKTGAEQDLTEGDYIFTADEAGTIEGRFSIRFAPAAGTAVEGVDAMAVKVAGGKGVITVSAPADAEVAVYAADGSMIANTRGNLEATAAAGVYVVTVDGQSFKTIVK